MKKFIKSTVAVACSFAMAFTMSAIPTVSAKADDTAPEPEVYDTLSLPDGETYYTVAGGFGKVTWNPVAKDATMTAVDGMDGVYSFTAELPAYDEEAEWNNRFKICKIDNTVLTNGWDHSMCIGTTTYGDNQSMIRILNEKEGTFTIYFDSKTGAVIVKDEAGDNVDVSISWVGYDTEANFMSVDDLSKTTVADWPADKVLVDAVPNLTAINEQFAKQFVEYDPLSFADGEKYYTIAGGFGKQTWNPLAKDQTMTPVSYADGVYSFTAELPAYDEEAEWNNRFKICQIDNTVLTNGWDHSMCIGTTTYGDNQSQIRILNETEGTFTIYFDSKTGAVDVLDADNKSVPLSISWVGYDSETNFMSVEELSKTTVADWPADKVLVDAVPNLAELNAALVPVATPVYDPLSFDNETYYTIAGGFGEMTWNPLAKAATMAPVEGKAGVYSFTAMLPAYDEAAEWNNRFKICQIDNTVLTNGWDHSICVGTTTYGDNQSQIRILNETAGTYTIYFDSTTGAVVVFDANKNIVPLSISWVGYDSETNFMSVEELSKTTVADWPADKVLVDAVPDLAKINSALVAKFEASLKLSASRKTIYTGKSTNSVTIKAVVTGDSNKVTWKSSKTSVATVSSKGKVTAKKAGTTTITATANGIKKTIKITVKNPTITVKNGSKKVSSVSVKAKKSVKLTVATSPAKAGISVTYGNSKAKKVIKISTKGNKVTVKGLKKGTATVKITSGKATKSVKVTVK